MSNLAKIQGSGAIAPSVPSPVGLVSSLEDAMKVGAILAQSGFFKGASNEAQAVAKIMRGHELGIPPVASLENVNVIEGRTSLSSALIASLIRRSKRYDYKILESSSAVCRIEFQDKVQDCAGVYEFTIEEAQAAKYGFDRDGRPSPFSPWTKTPKKMLFARAMSQGAGMYCPDIFQGEVVSEEESSEWGAARKAIAQSKESVLQSNEWVQFLANVAKCVFNGDSSGLSGEVESALNSFPDIVHSSIYREHERALEAIAAAEIPAIASRETPQTQDPQQPSPLERLATIRKLTGHTKAQCKAIATPMGLDVSKSGRWSSADVDRFRDALFVDWALGQSVFAGVEDTLTVFGEIQGDDDAAIWAVWQAQVDALKGRVGIAAEAAEVF